MDAIVIAVRIAAKRTARTMHRDELFERVPRAQRPRVSDS
jgi:hypothetical protein